MTRSLALLGLVLAANIACVFAAAAADAGIWLWGFRLDQPYSEVEEQLKSFDYATDTEAGGKEFFRKGTFKLNGRDFEYSLLVTVWKNRIASIYVGSDTLETPTGKWIVAQADWPAGFDTSGTPLGNRELAQHLVTRFEEQGLSFHLEESEEVDESDTTWIRVVSDSAKLRARPSHQGIVVRQLRPSETLLVVDTVNSYYLVRDEETESFSYVDQSAVEIVEHSAYCSWTYEGENFGVLVKYTPTETSAFVVSDDYIKYLEGKPPAPDEPYQSLTTAEAKSLVTKSKRHFTKHYKDNIRLVSVSAARKIEYAKFGKLLVYSEATLDQRFAVVKYSRTRKGHGMWVWRFVRASELTEDADDVIIGVQVWNTSERPVKVRDLDSHLYWRSDSGIWSYSDPSDYVEWWTYIGYALFHYPYGATLYFSPYHPGVLDEFNEYYGEGLYRFSQQSIEHAGVIGSLSL